MGRDLIVSAVELLEQYWFGQGVQQHSPSSSRSAVGRLLLVARY